MNLTLCHSLWTNRSHNMQFDKMQKPLRCSHLCVIKYIRHARPLSCETQRESDATERPIRHRFTRASEHNHHRSLSAQWTRTTLTDRARRVPRMHLEQQREDVRDSCFLSTLPVGALEGGRLDVERFGESVGHFPNRIYAPRSQVWARERSLFITHFLMRCEGAAGLPIDRAGPTGRGQTHFGIAQKDSRSPELQHALINTLHWMIYSAQNHEQSDCSRSPEMIDSLNYETYCKCQR